MFTPQIFIPSASSGVLSVSGGALSLCTANVSLIVIITTDSSVYISYGFKKTETSFGDLFLFVLVWQYSTNQNQCNNGRFKVRATYLKQ